MKVYIGYQIRRPDISNDFWRGEVCFEYPDSLTPGVAVARAACHLLVTMQQAVVGATHIHSFEILSVSVDSSEVVPAGVEWLAVSQ